MPNDPEIHRYWAQVAFGIAVCAACVLALLIMATCSQRNAYVVDPNKSGLYNCIGRPDPFAPSMKCDLVQAVTPEAK